jgi:hypothetical protein
MPGAANLRNAVHDHRNRVEQDGLHVRFRSVKPTSESRVSAKPFDFPGGSEDPPLQGRLLLDHGHFPQLDALNGLFAVEGHAFDLLDHVQAGFNFSKR